MIHKRMLIYILSMFLSVIAFAESSLTAKQIVKRVDKMLLTDSAYVEAEMIIKQSDINPRSLEFKSYSMGRDFALLEFTSPARDRGTKFLRREKTMWLYFPRADRVRQIKGHMLRQGMMGSDYSYEDASETDSKVDNYDAILLGEQTYRGRKVYRIKMVATTSKVSYHMHISLIDKEWFLPLKTELYAKSGILLKELQMWNVKRIGNRYYPMSSKMINKLSGDSSTDMVIKKIRINPKMREDVFSLRNLKRR